MTPEAEHGICAWCDREIRRDGLIWRSVVTGSLKCGKSPVRYHEPDTRRLPADKAAQTEEAKKPYCPTCNAVGMSHCAYPEECGGVIYPHMQPAPESPAKAGILWCSKCYMRRGCNRIKQGTFCGTCGTRIEEIAAPAPSQPVQAIEIPAALLERVELSRLHNGMPEDCLRLLANGQISVGKACEWLTIYFKTGRSDVIAKLGDDYDIRLDETSAGELIAALEQRIKELEAANGK